MSQAGKAALTACILMMVLAPLSSGKGVRPTTEGLARLSREQRMTLERIRDVALAVEAYSLEHEDYPGPTPGLVPLDFLTGYLIPGQLERLPESDGWGRTLHFWSRDSHYMIVSYGADGKQDVAYDESIKKEALAMVMTVCRGPVPRPTDDMVLVSGQYCTYPETLVK